MNPAQGLFDPGRPLALPDYSSDSTLVAAIIRRDRKATAEFVARYSDAVYAYARYRLAPRADVVDDLVQSVFLAAWRQLGNYNGNSSLESWLLGIARHKVQDFYRERLRHESSLDDDAGPVSREVIVEAGSEELIDRQRSQERTQRILAQLPESYALVLLWRYWEDRSTRDMAALTGKTEKAMERLLARARQEFKRSWGRG